MDRSPRVARYTWARQWPAAALFGVAQGVIALAPFAVMRSLGSSDLVVSLIITAWQFPWILAPLCEPLLLRLDPQRAFRWIGAAMFLPLLFVVFVDVDPVGPHGSGKGDLLLFLCLLFFESAANIAFVPHRGALIHANYPVEVRGRFYGLLTAVMILMSVFSSKAGGLLLDLDPRWLRAIYPAAALAGLLALRQYSRIRWRQARRQRAHGETLGFREAWRTTARI
ncbi:MAG: hypothetical protein ACREID_01185, partial [Planctomycetota bacterium]